tara:strand:+ start:4727 stop:5005 length:279 start_codon:yes stop_codon:yes gene_type:complete
MRQNHPVFAKKLKFFFFAFDVAMLVKRWYPGSTEIINYRKEFSMPVKCDNCGIFCSSLDAIATEEGLVFCGSFRGNGCDKKYDNGEFEIEIV